MGLHTKSFINLKIFGATFWIGGTIVPIAPLATRLAAGNRFHVKLPILSSENCKQSLWVKS